MANKKMNIKYKAQKRERKQKVEVTTKDQAKSIIFTFVGVVLFLGLFYLGMLGLEKLGLFQKGYTAPNAKEIEVSTEYITIGNVFNKSNQVYYVLFDNYENNFTSDSYVNALVDNISGTNVYKVDMSRPENAKFSSQKENKNATKSEELAINGVTLIKIKNGKIVKYVSGNENIEEYLSK